MFGCPPFEFPAADDFEAKLSTALPAVGCCFGICFSVWYAGPMAAVSDGVPMDGSDRSSIDKMS
jgi:hypothetical protein